MLLAVDGYSMAFSRIVQYQSVVILTSALVVLILYRLVRRPSAVLNYLSLAAALAAAGLMAHYEAALVFIPALYLLVVLAAAALVMAYRRGLGRAWGSAMGVLLVAGLALNAWNPSWLIVGAAGTSPCCSSWQL